MASISQSPILITGATGNVGRNVVSQLIDAGVRVRALARNPQTANLPEAVEIVRGDLSEPSTLESSLAGVETVFLLCRGYSPSTVSALIETLAQHARRIVFLSSSAIQDERPVQVNPIGKIHLDVESAIRKTGLEWTLLRPGAFAANALNWWAPQLRAGDVVRWPYANAAWAPIHEWDIASVAVRALTQDGHIGETYLLTGGEVLTQTEQLHVIGEATGRVLRYEELSPNEARRQMSAFLPPFVTERLLEIWAGMVKKPAPVTRTVEEITGAPPRTFRQWAGDHAAAFRLASKDA